MKKFLGLIAIIAIVVLSSCDSDDPVTPDVKESGIFLVNERGDVGTLSRINPDLTIDNDIVNTGKWATDIAYADGKIFVVLSGDDYIKVIDAETLDDVDASSIEMSDVNVDHPNDIAVYNGKVYITSTTGGVEIYNLSTSSFETKINILGGHGKGTGDIIVNGDFIYAKRNDYHGTYPNTIFEKEYVFKIDLTNNQIVDSVETGINASKLLVDNDGDLHVMYTGNYADVKGGVAIVDLNTFELEDTIDFNKGLGGFAMDSKGMIYVAMSDYDASWNATCGIMKYNSVTNAVINDAQNLIFEAPYSAMGFLIDSSDRLYLPFYKTDNENPENPDSLKIFENEQVVKTLETGNGPQMMIEVDL